MPSNHRDVIEQVRTRYAAAAQTVLNGEGPATDCGCGQGDCGCATGCCGPFDAVRVVDAREGFGAELYQDADRDQLPAEAILASLGCGNPTAVAALDPGEVVLDLGSGGGIDVLLSARRVGPTGKAYGLDMTGEMLDLARATTAKAGVTNVEFLKGHIEAIPVPDASVDVVISNCVVNLSPDKPAVLAEVARVLRPGGRVGISDVVAEDQLTSEDRQARGTYIGCIAGALSISEYQRGLAAVGLTGITITLTHQVADGLHGAIVQAIRPVPTGCC